ncbi:hypothetical protein U1Q18_036863 [Sarracenia purpurea var. burkii]
MNRRFATVDGGGSRRVRNASDSGFEDWLFFFVHERIDLLEFVSPGKMKSSPEFVESARAARAPEKLSNFSQTCSLLSQYLKEKKGGFGGLSLGMSCGFDDEGMPETFSQTATATTMNLFPVVDKKLGIVSGALTRNPALMPRNTSSSLDLFSQHSGFASKEEVPKPKKFDSSGNNSGPERAQMTIFYAGKVIVFDDFPADKAKEVMLLASKGSSPNAGAFSSPPVHLTNLIPTTGSTTVVSNPGNLNMTQELPQRPPQPIGSDLPKIARKASLTRFLEKRKDRITARAPYPTSNSTAFPPKPAENKSWLGLAAQYPVQFQAQ